MSVWKHTVNENKIESIFCHFSFVLMLLLILSYCLNIFFKGMITKYFNRIS